MTWASFSTLKSAPSYHPKAIPATPTPVEKQIFPGNPTPPNLLFEEWVLKQKHLPQLPLGEVLKKPVALQTPELSGGFCYDLTPPPAEIK